MIRVLIADDHASFREGLARLLSDEADLEVVAQATNGDEAVSLAADLLPDVAVLDASMPKLNGIEATRQIIAACPATTILILSAYSSESYVLGALEAGAAGYLLKRTRVYRIVEAIRAVHEGETVFDSLATGRLFQKLASAKERRGNSSQGFSDRELQTLRLAAKGMSNKEIAHALGLSVRTVQNHLVNIFNKLGVGSRTEAVLRAVKQGWLSTDDLP